MESHIEADENGFVVSYSQFSPLIWILPVAIFFIINYFVNRQNGENDRVPSYTACSNPLCVRCQQYQVLRHSASEKIETISNEGNKHKLKRIAAGLAYTEVNDDQQCNVFYMPGLRAQPIWNTDLTSPNLNSTIQHIEDNFNVISDDYKRAANSSSASLWSVNTTERGRWKTFYLYNQGKRIDQNCEVCPKTCALLESRTEFMKGCVFGHALFSVVEPGTLITEHYGPTNIRLRCHLGLVIPSDVTLTVKGEDHTWREGRCIVFDDSFLHAVDSRNAETERVVLILDLWHPEISDSEKEALSILFT